MKKFGPFKKSVYEPRRPDLGGGDGRTDRRTEGRTDERTDGQSVTPVCNVVKDQGNLTECPEIGKL